jgi:hypothetical protein
MDSNNPSPRYQEAAERLLVSLSSLATTHSGRPIPAVRLARLAFDTAAQPWGHETKRRRIREAVTVARTLLRQRQQKVELVANTAGYWLTGDSDILFWYASKRRHRGLSELAASSKVTHGPALSASKGQAELFPLGDGSWT